MAESCDYNCSNCPHGFQHEMECADEFENGLVEI